MLWFYIAPCLGLTLPLSVGELSLALFLFRFGHNPTVSTTILSFLLREHSRSRESERENQFKKHMCIEIAAVLGIPQSRSASCCSLKPQTKEADVAVTLPFFLPLRPAPLLAPSFACNSQFPRNIDEMIGYICRVRDVAPSECSTPPRPPLLQVAVLFYGR